MTQELTQSDIQATVEKALKDNGLEGIVTSDQVTELTTLMSDMKDKNIFGRFCQRVDSFRSPQTN